jgi:hypothetical protein
MKATGAYYNKTGNPMGNSYQSSTGGKSAGRPPPAAAGGGAMASMEVERRCKFRINCTNMHCEFTDKQHGPNFTRQTSCWKKGLGQHCKICDPRQPNNMCQFGANCQRKETCQFLHPAPVKVSNAPDVQPDQEAQAKENGATTGSASTEEEFPYLVEGNHEVVPVVAGDWSKLNDSEDSEDKSSVIGEIVTAFSSYPCFEHLIQILENNLQALQTRAQLIKYANRLIEALAKIAILEFEDESLKENFDKLFPAVMTLAFSEGAMPQFPEETSIFDMLIPFVSVHETLEELIKKLGLPVPISGCSELGTSIIEQIRFAISHISEMMAKVPPMKQGDFQKSLGLLKANDILSFPPKLVKQILLFAETSYNKILEQIRIEEDARIQGIRMSLLDPKRFDVKTSIDESKLMLMAYIFAINFMMGANTKMFQDYVSTRHSEHAELINKNQKSFFEHLVRSIYRKLIRCDSDVSDFQTAVLTSDFSSVQEIVESIFSTAVNWFLLSEKSSEDSVYQSLMRFSSWNDDSSLLKPEFLDFIYSSIQIGKNQTQTAQISKLVDNHFVVIQKYFGIRMVPSPTGFGKMFVLSYRDKDTGDSREIDVSGLISRYVFDIICMSKVFLDTKKSSCVPYGNPGIPGSISHLFDMVGNETLQFDKFGTYLPYVAPSKDKKGQPESVPPIFTPPVFREISKKLGKDHQSVSHEDVLKFFLGASKKCLIDRSFISSQKTDKDSFQTSVKSIQESFLPSSPNEVSMLRFYLFLSTLESDPMMKLFKTGIEFLTNKSLKKDLVNGLNFLNPEDVGELDKTIIRNFLENCSIIADENKLNQKVEEIVNGLSEALNFVASSGVSLVEVLHVGRIFKDLFNKNKTTGSMKMVFFNTFLTSIMVAGSKKLNLSFATMYNSLVTSLLPNDREPFLKHTNSFKEDFRYAVSQIRSTGFRFDSCQRDSFCELFCREASARVSDNPQHILKFNKLVASVCPFIMISEIMSKQDSQSVVDGTYMSLSDRMDRVSILLLTTSNRIELFQLFGLMNPDVKKDTEKHTWYMCSCDSSNSRDKKPSDIQEFEKTLITSTRTSITASTISDYFKTWNEFQKRNADDMKSALSPQDIKELRKEFRKKSEMETFFSTIENSGLATKELLQFLKTNPKLYTKNKHGGDVLNIVLIANKIVAENTMFSLHFYEDILKMVHSALYPNFDDRAAARNMVWEMVQIQKAARRQELGQAPVQSVQEERVKDDVNGVSLFEAMFGDEHEPEHEHEHEPTAENLKDVFLKMLDESTRDLVSQRLPTILFTDSVVRDFFKNHRNDASPPELLSKFLTSFTALETMFGFEKAIGFFSNIKTYVETFFEDDEDENIDLSQFRTDVLNESSPLGAAFKRYVDAAIKEARASLSLSV